MAERIQYKLCTCIPLPTRISIMLPSTDSLSGGEHHGVVCGQSHHPTGLCLRREGQHWVTVPSLQPDHGLELPSGRHSSLISGHFQTFTKSHLFPQYFCLSFRVTIVTLYSALEATLRYLWHSTNWLFYITLHSVGLCRCRCFYAEMFPFHYNVLL